jgi:hypothetical protein
MAFKVPKIIYDPGVGDVTLNFTYPPVQKPGTDDEEATRHDSITCSGLKQSVWERTDEFKILQMDYVPMADLPDWKDFIKYALTGGEFKYFVDSTEPDWVMYTLEDTEFRPKFSLKLRKVVPDDCSS